MKALRMWRETMTKIFFTVVVLAVVLAGAQVVAHPDKAATAATPVPAELPRIQSSELRIEFDKNMHSRVVARLNGKETPLGAFSASETVKGSDRSWNDFALASQAREHVSDSFGQWRKADHYRQHPVCCGKTCRSRFMTTCPVLRYLTSTTRIPGKRSWRFSSGTTTLHDRRAERR